MLDVMLNLKLVAPLEKFLVLLCGAVFARVVYWTAMTWLSPICIARAEKRAVQWRQMRFELPIEVRVLARILRPVFAALTPRNFAAFRFARVFLTSESSGRSPRKREPS
jgi:hypothetical protein